MAAATTTIAAAAYLSFLFKACPRVEDTFARQHFCSICGGEHGSRDAWRHNLCAACRCRTRPLQSAISRRKFFASVAGTGTLILPIHFPAPTVGLITADGDRFDYRFKRD